MSRKSCSTDFKIESVRIQLVANSNQLNLQFALTAFQNFHLTPRHKKVIMLNVPKVGVFDSENKRTYRLNI